MANTVILYSSIVLLFVLSAGLFFTTQQKIEQLQATGLQAANPQNPMGDKMSRMSFSDFDRQTAKNSWTKMGTENAIHAACL